MAPYLSEIAKIAEGSSVRLDISIFVTCLCDPGAVPSIPHTTVSIEKPSVKTIVEGLLPSEGEGGGGFAIAASGPPSLAKEARNTIAGLTKGQRRRFGDLNIHTEVYDI
jgi:ferric-chelate reductase